MSSSCKEIQERLKKVREKARIAGQICENIELESNQRYIIRRDIKKDFNFNETYIAIAKAVTDVYCNDISKTSEPLRMFIVKPNIRRNMLGKLVVTGFNEAITGEKIVNRKYVFSDDGSYVEDRDCLINKVVQIGDLAWYVVDKSTADRLLSPLELQEYMSLSPEEIQEQLKMTREKARTIGYNRCNYNEGNYIYRKNMESDQTYVAIAKAVISISPNGEAKTSKPLGMFIVKPEIKRNAIGIKKVAGFKEVITGEKIVNSKLYITEDKTYNEDKDCEAGKTVQVGDLTWSIVDKSTADRLLSPLELQQYMSLSPEEINEEINKIRLMANYNIDLSENNRKLARVVRK